MAELLTSLDVVNQSFKKGIRGYDGAEVDEFLDNVAETLQQYSQRTKDLEREVEEKGKKLEEYNSMKNVLQEALIMAQKSADERVQGARTQAAKIISDAEQQAKNIISDAEHEAETLREKITDIRTIRADYENEFRKIMAKFTDMLDGLDSRTELKDKVDELIESASVEGESSKPAVAQSGEEQPTVNKNDLKAAYAMLGVDPEEILKEKDDTEEHAEED